MWEQPPSAVRPSEAWQGLAVKWSMKKTILPLLSLSNATLRADILPAVCAGGTPALPRN